MDRLLGAAVGWARYWSWAVTWGLSPEQAQRRRREIESDLWEHTDRALSDGVARAAVAGQVLLRSLAGIPSDISWRTRLAFSRSPVSRPAFNKVIAVALCLLGVAGTVQLSGNLAALSEMRAARDAARARAAATVSNPIDYLNKAAAALAGGLPAVRVTYDGGNSWKQYALPAPADAQRCSQSWCGGRPVLSFGRDGTLWAAFAIQGSAEGVWLSRSPDGGACFTAPRQVVDGPATPLAVAPGDPGKASVKVSRPPSEGVRASDDRSAFVDFATPDVAAGRPAAAGSCSPAAAAPVIGARPPRFPDAPCQGPAAPPQWLTLFILAGLWIPRKRGPCRGPGMLQTA